ncbi:MAG: membrane protein insertion efficiency factor YidD [Candidatus Omnitrophica bacterium]|nr:membrane protein insertion efficiency factor YidD [Candidatus Omnitrophota bacterium]
MVKKIILKMITVYRLYISPLIGNHCRFHPTCSRYFQEAVSMYGLLRGTLRGLSRILRCHPFSAGGFDPLTK